jgi:putative transposase
MLFVRKYDPAIHHRKSIRLRGYDCSRQGRYFITLCCQGREHRFGNIENGLLILNDAGSMIEKWHRELANKFPGIELGEYIIMPNHFHAIIIISGNPVWADPRVRPDIMGDHVGSPRLDRPSLSRIVQWFKTMTTNEYIRGVKNLGWDRFDGKLWQRDYYEHIIRDEKAYLAISNYIINNPANWIDDEYFR